MEIKLVYLAAGGIYYPKETSYGHVCGRVIPREVSPQRHAAYFVTQKSEDFVCDVFRL